MKSRRPGAALFASAALGCLFGAEVAARHIMQAPIGPAPVLGPVPDFQQCGGTINCPIEIVDTDLCGDRKYRGCANATSACNRVNNYYWQCQTSSLSAGHPVSSHELPPPPPIGAASPTGPLSATETGTVPSPPIQVFPGGYYLCQPGQKIYPCVTASPGRRLLLGHTSAEKSLQTRSVLSADAQRNAFIYPAEPDAPPSNDATTPGTGSSSLQVIPHRSKQASWALSTFDGNGHIGLEFHSAPGLSCGFIKRLT